jgi:hypothetical protein
MLARHDWAAALTRDGLERTDILAVGTTLEGRPLVEIQVKTATGASEKTSWALNRQAQQLARSPREWFVFVAVPALPGGPLGFVVPRDHVAAATWLPGPVRATRHSIGLVSGWRCGRATRTAGTFWRHRPTRCLSCFPAGSGSGRSKPGWVFLPDIPG